MIYFIIVMEEIWIFDTAIGEYKGKDVIWIWGSDKAGNFHLLVEPHYKDYFYVDKSRVSYEQIQDLFRMNLGSLFKSIHLEEVSKKLYGVYSDFIKVLGEFEVIKKASDIVEKKFGDDVIFEDDIRPSQKFIMDNEITPCQWYRIDYDPIDENDNVKIGLLKDISPVLEEKDYPNLKILSMDAILGSKYGAPDPDLDPVIGIIAFDGKEYYEFISDGSDMKVIEELEKLVKNVDPHVILGFETNSIIFPYLVERGKRFKRIPKLGKFGTEIHQSVLGHFSIGGRINIDLKEYVDDLPFFQRKTLEELADYLRLKSIEYPIDKYLYYQYWMESRDELINYIRWRLKVIYESYNKLIDHIFALSNTTGIPPDYVLTASSGRQAEYYIMRIARRRDEIVPKVRQRPYKPYPGGLVLKPKKGLIENIAVIDYKSMYPSIMIKYNISPETIISTPEGDVLFFEEVGYGVRRDVDGLFPTILRDLVQKRDNIRKMMKDVDPKSSVYKILDARQRVLKILANTMYGYMGWLGARWYSYEGASIVTYLGRRTITLSIDKANSIGLEVVYGDTDSLFVKNDEDKVKVLLNWISEELGLEAKIDKIYKRILFTEAKKRYAGLTIDGALEIVGLEYVRRDWCDYAREAQHTIVQMVLEGASKDKILDVFRDYVRNLRRKNVDVRKLIIWEQITKAIEEYKVNAPHVEVARRLMQDGWRVKRGVFIGYIILKGDGPLYKRAVHYTKVDTKLIDWDYYIFNQLLPVVSRVLTPIGISEKTLESIARSGGVGLDMFV